MIKKIGEPKAKRDELLRRIQAAEQNKKKTEGIVQKLVVKYQIGELSYNQYNEEIKKVFQTKTPEQWINYYDKYIQQCQTLLGTLNSQLKTKSIKKFAFIFLPIFAAIILFVILFSSSQINIFFSPEQNETFPNQTIEEQIPISEEITNISEQPEENITEINATIPELIAEENITVSEQNETFPNQTIEEQIPISEENVTVPEPILEQPIQINTTAIQYKAVINRPVNWIKIVDLEDPSRNLAVEIPTQSQNISIKTGEEVRQALLQAEQYKQSIEKADRKEFLKEKIQFSPPVEETFFGKLLTFIIRFFSLFSKSSVTSSVIYEDEIQGSITQTKTGKIIDLENFATPEEKEIAIEYTTEAPQTVEQEISNGKRITITGPDEIHYQDVLAYTELPNNIPITQKDKIRVYRTTEGRERVQFTAYDLDADDFVDYIEWTVPYLSEQTYEIIFVTKAEHLDANRIFVEDVYELVKAQDNSWGLVPAGDYLRVTFEQELDNTKDITFFGKSSGVASVEVYEKDGIEMIARFDNVGEDKKYQIFLTNLAGEQDTFDLKILNSNVEFDYVLDPLPVQPPPVQPPPELQPPPQISFISPPTPEDGSTHYSTEIYVSASSSDSTGRHYVLNNLDNSLVGWWRMDDVDTAGEPLDLSGYSNNGIRKGGAIINVSGYWGDGCWFDGEDAYIEVTANNLLNFDADKEYTWSAWIYTNQQILTGSEFGLMRKCDPQDEFGYSIYIEGNRKLTLDDCSESHTVKYSTLEVPSITWTHLAIAYSNKEFTFYIDGESAGSGTLPNIKSDSSSNLLIGRAYNSLISSEFYANGAIDEVIIFNRSLSLSEIKSLYNASKYQYYNNFISLAEGEHTFKAYAVDSAGNLNSTETRAFTVLESIAPNISFTGETPANASNQIWTSIVVNVSSADNNREHYVVNDFDNSLLLLMRMDDVNFSGDPTDLSSYSNNGSKAGNATQTGKGKFGRGFGFDGDGDYITINNAGAMNFSGYTNFTVSFWGKRANAEVNIGRLAIAKGNPGNTDGAGWSIHVGHGETDRIEFFYNNGTGSGTQNRWNGVVSVEDTTWHLYTYVNVYDGSGWEKSILYIDSSPLGSKAVEALDKTGGIFTASPTLIGVGKQTDSVYANGTIDEVLIFNRSLSISEIQSLYNATKSQYYNNFTDLAFGNHLFKAYAVDLAGNLNFTEQRTVKIRSPCTEIASCDSGTPQINVPNMCYYLTNDISATGTCLTIDADNITLNGNQYTITGDNSGQDYGISVLNRLNTTIQNITIIDFNGNGAGIYYENSENSTVQSVNVFNCSFGISSRSSYSNSNNNVFSDIRIENNGAYGMDIWSVSNSIFTNITLNNNTAGIDLGSSSNNIFTNFTANYNLYGGMFLHAANNNTFTKVTSNNNRRDGISITSSSSNNIFTNFTSSNNINGIGLYLDSKSNNNTFANFTSSNNLISGIYVSFSDNNLFSQGMIDNPLGENAIYEIGESINNTFKNISVIGSLYEDIVLSSPFLLENTTLIDMVLKKYSFAENKVIFEDAAEGKIQFLEEIFGTGNDLSKDINIKHNRILIDATNNAGLGKSAKINLYNFPAQGKTGTLNVLRNGRICTTCTDIQPATIEATTESVSFKTPGFDRYSSYSIGNEQDPYIIQIRNLDPVDFADDEKNHIVGEDVEVTFEVDVAASSSATLEPNFTLDRTEQTVRIGSCEFSSDMVDYLVYTCRVYMKYWDEPTEDWYVNLKLTEGTASDEYSEQFEVLPYQSFDIVTDPESIEWTNVYSGQIEPVPSDYPLRIKNTGNIELNELYIQAFDLPHVSLSNYIPSFSFSAKSGANACESGASFFGSGLPTEITSFQSLPTSAPPTLPQETERDIFFCFDVPSGLPGGSYSTSSGTDWEIDITFALALVVIPRRKKKKSKKEILELVEERLREQKEDILELVEERLREKSSAVEEDLKIPIEIFAQDISPAEALTKYLKENQNLTYSQIAQLLNRDQRTIWINYRNASSKKQNKFRTSEKTIYVSIKIFSDRNLSISESLVGNLRNSGMTNTAISNLLNKDPRNIHTIFKRAIKKRNI